MTWPHQDEKSLNEFYGDNWGPHGPGDAHWESANLVDWFPPYPMYYAGKRLSRLKVHKKCLATFDAAFKDVLSTLGLPYIIVHHLDQTGGAYCPRTERGGTKLSVHSWGCAIDMDPARNPFPHDWVPGMIDKKFAEILQKHGFTWRGANGDVDPMHFQLAMRGK
jgi:hypothetical protein